ncbi:uncharacterized protein NDAI_0A02260 [Naumovozyma dairenensis CBS 421]|uniref:Uncharacterized protein n=1 Tax=Naumovozyma dairenensis (strain ATCC 10597 / BCRC 20456 / CBS 421 / NBRC 0211 / NRRL Y-12639) TaxID=1071378 RepID=G0W3J6_NAUDC|nr:hypothetical protein NDAI_0A02260 [Naumovozyma dairenensis CBS 421]CCD22384.1 hypothetical protein NDAI_0A02260 [Naumovozyma dairenensis CBS 421]
MRKNKGSNLAVKQTPAHLITPEEPKAYSHKNNPIERGSKETAQKYGNREPESSSMEKHLGLQEKGIGEQKERGKDEKRDQIPLSEIPLHTVERRNSTGNDIFYSSLKDTRTLEQSIMALIKKLKDDGHSETVEVTDSEIEKEEIIEILGRSLMALSHWTVQAQLAQLQSKNNERTAVETNLLKKEVELLQDRNNFSTVESPPLPISKVEYVQKPVVEEGMRVIYPRKHYAISKKQRKTTNTIKWKNQFIKTPSNKKTPSELTPTATTIENEGVSLSPKISFVEKQNDSIEDSTHIHKELPTRRTNPYKLEERNKIQPRIRRISDNPSANEGVRIFRLRKTLDDEI